MRSIQTFKQFTRYANICGTKKGCPVVGLEFNGRFYKAMVPGQISMSKVTRNLNFMMSPECLIAFNFNPKKSRRKRLSKPHIIEISYGPGQFKRFHYIH